MIRHLSSICVLLPLLATSASADNWPGWRGPGSNGVSPGQSFPVQWSATENVAWKVSLPPGGSGSTPAVWDDHIFVTCPGEDKNLVICFDRNGNKRWSKTIGNQRPGKHKKGSGSNPSPTTDGQHVYVYYKSGDLACLDYEGNIIWQNNLQDDFGQDTLWWDLGTSPVLTKERVVVACMQSDPSPSYLAAFDRYTGKRVWNQKREFDAPEEANQSYSTPVVVNFQGQERIVVLGADHVTGHDAETGEERWRVGDLNPDGEKYFRSIASPVVSDGMVIAPYARGATLTAIRLGGRGDVTESHVAWVNKGLSADVPTPAATDGKVYVCTDKGELACLDIKTGEELWGQRMEKNRNAYSSSPVLAGGNVYVTREDGKTFVVEAKHPFKVLAENELDEFTLATLVFADGQILIKTFEHLYCIGKPLKVSQKLESRTEAR